MRQNQLNHFDESGRAVMVDVSAKAETSRTAVAEGCITMNGAAFEAVRTGSAKKGDVLGVARVAGIMAVKRTSELIPMCHPLMVEKAALDFELDPDARRVRAVCTVTITGKTGVEMEAMTGVSVALLTIYDMCKAVDRAMQMDAIRLVEKKGGKSGHYQRVDTREDTQP